MVDQFIRDTAHDRYPVAVHLVLTDRLTGRVLLMRREGTDYGRHRLAFVAGHVDVGEKVTECVIRESAEEVGIEFDPVDLVPAGVMFRRSGEPRVDFFFAADARKGVPRICEPLTQRHQRCPNTRLVPACAGENTPLAECSAVS